MKNSILAQAFQTTEKQSAMEQAFRSGYGWETGISSKAPSNGAIGPTGPSDIERAFHREFLQQAEKQQSTQTPVWSSRLKQAFAVTPATSGTKREVLTGPGEEESVNRPFETSEQKAARAAKDSLTMQAIEQRDKIIEENKKKQARNSLNDWEYTYNAAMKGLNDFNASLTQTLDNTVGNALRAIGWEDNPIGAINSYYQGLRDSYSKKMKKYEDTLDNPIVDFYGELVSGVASAAPDAILAMASGGASEGATLSAQAMKATQAGSNLLKKAGATAREMMKKPQFWLSYARTYGNEYEEAKRLGASDAVAAFGATFTSFANAGIEIGPDGGGGIQGFAESLSKGNKKPLYEWVKSSLEEGGEEVLQGYITRATQKALYDSSVSMPTIDEMAHEFTMGALIGGILGGGQMAASNIMSEISEGQRTKISQNAEGAVLQYVESSKNGGIGEDAAELVRESINEGLSGVWNAEKNETDVFSEEVIYSGILGAASKKADNVSFGQGQKKLTHDFVVETAQKRGVSEDVYQPVAKVASELNRVVRFATPEEMQVISENGQVSVPNGRYDPAQNAIVLNSKLSAQEAVEFVLKHELTHSIQGTKQWVQLEQIVRTNYGEVAFAQKVADVKAKYAAKGIELNDTQAVQEVVADWVGENLYNGRFFEAVANGDATAGNAFRQLFDRLRLAFGGTKNSRTAGNIALVERLFMRAMESENGNEQKSAGEQYTVSLEMTEQQRYEELKDRTIIAVQDRSSEIEGLSLEELENRAKSKAEMVIYPLAEKLGVHGRELRTPELDITFQFSKNGGLKEGLNTQLKYGGSYADFARALINLDAILQNSVVIEQHTDKYSGTSREDRNLRMVSVLLGAYQTGNILVPVQCEIKTTRDNDNKLYVIVALTKEEIGVAGRAEVEQTQPAQALLPISKYKIADIFKNINPRDAEFLKYAPDGFLNDEQKTAKQAALAAERKRIDSYPKKKQQFSFGRVNGKNIDIEYDGDVPASTVSPQPTDAAAVQPSGDEQTANSQALANETADSEIVVQAAPVQRTADEYKKVSQARTVDELEQELSDRELFNRAYMSEQLDRPPATATIGGAEVDTAAYMNLVEDTLPDTEEGIAQFVESVSVRYAQEIADEFEKTGEISSETSAAKLQLIAADRKLTRIRLLDGESDGKVFRRFFENRLKNLDANRTHADEMVAYIAGRDERYSPISNQKTLDEAKAKLRQEGYARKIERRIKRYRPGQTLDAVDMAAAQVMINDAKNAGDFVLFDELVRGVSRYGTELGRAVQIMSMQRRLTPEGTLRAAERTLKNAIDEQHGEGAADSIDTVSSTIVDAIERAEEARSGQVDNNVVSGEQIGQGKETDADDVRVVPQGLSRDQLETALGDAIVKEKSPYITEEEIRDIIHRSVEASTNISKHVKKMLRDTKVQKTLAEKITDIYQNGHLTDAKIRTAMEDALGLPTLSTEDVSHLVKLVEVAQSTDANTLSRADAEEEIYRFLAQKLPTTKMEALMNWRKFSMLFNPKTHIRNILSNVVMQKGINRVDDTIATALQKMIIRDPAQRTALVGWRGTDFGRQLVKNGTLEQQVENALVQLRGSEKYEMTYRKLGQYKKQFEVLFGKKVGAFFDRLNDVNSNWLETEDVWAFKPAFTDALGQVLTVRQTTDVTPEIFDIAFRKATETVFRAENAAATVLSQMKEGLFDANTKKGKKMLGYIADIVMPFSKTPANIAVSAFQHSPIALVKTAYDFVKTSQDAANAKTMAENINSLSKNITGTLLFGVGVLLANAGWFNTGYGASEKERAADELAGIQQNSITVFGFSITLDWLQPTAAPLIMGASFMQRFKEGGMSLKDVGATIMDSTDSLFEMTMLQSLFDVLGGYNAGVSGSAASIAENLVSQSIPTLFGQLARAVDPVQRKTRGENDFETVVNQVISKMPGFSYLLEPELDVWGNVVYRTGKATPGNAIINAIQQFVLPFNYKQAPAENDHLSQAVLALYNSGENRPSRAIPSAVTMEDAKELGVDYTKLVQAIAQEQREKVEELMSDKRRYSVQTTTESGKKRTVKKKWSQMTADEQLRVLERIYKEVKEEALDPKTRLYDELIGGLRNGN